MRDDGRRRLRSQATLVVSYQLNEISKGARPNSQIMMGAKKRPTDSNQWVFASFLKGKEFASR
jgi:hypothetical protein